MVEYDYYSRLFSAVAQPAFHAPLGAVLPVAPTAVFVYLVMLCMVCGNVLLK